MRPEFLAELRPICPTCRQVDPRALHPLRLSHVLAESAGHVEQGALVCENPQCQREYPIVDGIPILVPAIRAFVEHQLLPLLVRDDLHPVVASMLGDCAGPASPWDTLRQQISSYAWDHFGDFASSETTRDSIDGDSSVRRADQADLSSGSHGASGSPSAIARLTRQALTLVDDQAARGDVDAPRVGPWLDVGCGPGRSAWELAAQAGRRVLGIDLNWGLLRVASRVLRHGSLRYDRRRVGLVYDREEYPVPLPGAENLDFWCCDASALPFAPETFVGAVAFNVLDATPSPLALLQSVALALRPDAPCLVASPYDWSTAATPFEQWLGGHSQRGPQQGQSAAVVRDVLRQLGDERGEPLWRIIAERDDVPWTVRIHDRHFSQYLVHLLALRRSSPSAGVSTVSGD